MLRRFLFLGAGALALMVVLGIPGQLHAQGFRRGGFPMVQPGFRLRPGFPGAFTPGFMGRPGAFTPGFRGRPGAFTPGFRGRFDPRFGTSFNRGLFFDPRFSSGVFAPPFSSGFGSGFFPPF